MLLSPVLPVSAALNDAGEDVRRSIGHLYCSREDLGRMPRQRHMLVIAFAFHPSCRNVPTWRRGIQALQLRKPSTCDLAVSLPCQYCEANDVSDRLRYA